MTTKSDISGLFDQSVINRLEEPNGAYYHIGVSGDVTITKEELDLFDGDGFQSNPDAFVLLANRLLAINKPKVAVTLDAQNYNGQHRKYLNKLKDLLSLVNDHAQSVRTGDEAEDALKNNIVGSILKLTKSAKNQVSAMMPIAMDEQQDAAKLSALGAAERPITSDNPATKFMMQVQNMVGKEVIGITAVGLKGFFGLSTYYGIKIKELARSINAYGNFDELTLNDKVYLQGELTKFMRGHKAPLANLDYEPIIEALRRNGWPQDVIEWTERTHMLANQNDAALAISGLLSAATDSRCQL